MVATGEQVTIGLLALAIQAAGGQATSFLGHQCRIVTDSTFTKARIKRIDAEPLRAALARGDIAVVAGFQGIDEEGNVTTLGRGGSDTTAVALAAALKAERCEIYTDVDGVYTTDPNVCPAARKLDRISYEEMLELASLGAKVLQIRSVEFAMKYKVPLWVKSSFTDDPGTLVCEEDEAMEDVLVSGIAYDENEAQARAARRAGQARGGGAASSARSTSGTSWWTSSSRTAQQDGRTDLTLHRGQGGPAKARDAMDRLVSGAGPSRGGERRSDRQGLHRRRRACATTPAWPRGCSRCLGKEGINIQSISTSEIKVSCVIEAKYTELAVRALHTAFGLDRADAAAAR